MIMHTVHASPREASKLKGASPAIVNTVTQ